MLVVAATFIVLVATIALDASRVLEARAKGLVIPRSAIAWGVVFALVQLFIGVYAAMGNVADDVLSALVLNVALTGASYLSFSRAQVAPRLLGVFGPDATAVRGRLAHPLVASIVLVLLAAVFAGLALEIPSNHDLYRMYPACALLEWFLIAAPMLALFFLAQRRGTAPAVLAVALHVLGLAQYFVITFKTMPIQPGDISAIPTAVSVSGGYDYALSAFCLYGMALAVVAAALCQLAGIFRPVEPARAKGEKRSAAARGRLVANLLVGVAMLAGLTAHVTLIDYYHTLSVQVYTWRPLESYYTEGFLPCFVSATQTIIPSKPKGYDEDDAKKLVEKYAARYDKSDAATSEGRAAAEQQFDDEKPTVITIMNETFSDLSIYQNLHTDYQGPQFFKSLSDTLQRGTLYVSAYGGGTANTEFEYLTGDSMAFLGSGVYPYTIYDMQNQENLAAQFKKLGYATTAMHPNHGSNWNRSNVYSQFGFDTFLTINDFQDAEKLRGMVTDRATYDKILDLLNSNSDPQFIFDVTMQNHSGYDTGLLPADKEQHYTIDGVNDPNVDEYLSLIQESDEALKYFVGQLEKLDRKVVLVFFGDHQPFFPDRYNEAWFQGEDAGLHAERLWQTDYIIWANYDVAGRDQVSANVPLSTNYLGSSLMELIGAPLTDYEKAHLSLREAMPAINATGFADKSMQWYLSSAATAEGTDEDAKKARADLEEMQFYMLFKNGKNYFTKTFQTEANETNPNLAPGTTAQ